MDQYIALACLQKKSYLLLDRLMKCIYVNNLLNTLYIRLVHADPHTS